MKSWLLPLTTTLGAAGAITLMLATQAAPAPENSSEAMRQTQQMAHQNRLREWSQGLGIHLSGRTVVARAEKIPAPADNDRRTFDRDPTGTRAADDGQRHEHGDKPDRRKDGEHEDADEAVF